MRRHPRRRRPVVGFRRRPPPPPPEAVSQSRRQASPPAGTWQAHAPMGSEKEVEGHGKAVKSQWKTKAVSYRCLPRRPVSAAHGVAAGPPQRLTTRQRRCFSHKGQVETHGKRQCRNTKGKWKHKAKAVSYVWAKSGCSRARQGAGNRRRVGLSPVPFFAQSPAVLNAKASVSGRMAAAPQAKALVFGNSASEACS